MVHASREAGQRVPPFCAPSGHSMGWRHGGERGTRGVGRARAPSHTMDRQFACRGSVETKGVRDEKWRVPSLSAPLPACAQRGLGMQERVGGGAARAGGALHSAPLASSRCRVGDGVARKGYTPHPFTPYPCLVKQHGARGALYLSLCDPPPPAF